MFYYNKIFCMTLTTDNLWDVAAKYDNWKKKTAAVTLKNNVKYNSIGF